MSIPDQHQTFSETDNLLRTAVACALINEDFSAGLDRFRQTLETTAPGLVAQIPPDDDVRRGMALAIFREVWKVLPRPERGWRPLPAPKAERNAPCLCGSGRKFKQCCGALAGPPPFGDGLSVLGYVLERLTAREYASLPFKLLMPEEIAHVAEEWCKQDRHEAAAALLEALLADLAQLDSRHEYAFDVLGDIYLDLGRADARLALVETMMRSPNRELRSAAMHRRCTILADAGDDEGAWQLFREAQRLDPDNPSLAQLELVLLASRGQTEQLAARARFWATRLRKIGYEGEELIDFIADVARDPDGFIRTMAEQGGGAPDAAALLRFAELAAAMPAPACHYRLQAQDDSAGPLESDASLSRLERDWQAHFPQDEGAVWSDTGWLAWLAAHPLAWQSFAVLADLAQAVDEFPLEDDEEGELLDDIEEALLERALALLRLTLAESGADGLKLEWGWVENRAALSLLARKIELAGGTEEELPLLEWLVLTLNPNDNQGLREDLVHAYAAAARPADALAVCDRYPDDALGGMRYGRVLALILLDRRGEATAALAEATQRAPRILKTLVAARPKKPQTQPGFITLGGEDEAWHYRMRWLGVWKSTGALAWLKQATGAKG